MFTDWEMKNYQSYQTAYDKVDVNGFSHLTLEPTGRFSISV
jgi:hypothetical protein